MLRPCDSSGALVLAAHFIAGPSSLLTAGPGAPAVPASQIVQSLRQHLPVDLAGVHVVGTLDLRGIDAVTTAILCRRCSLDGLSVANVTFDRTFDFTDAIIAGPVDASGASFNGPVLMSGAAFGGDVDFSDDTLANLVDFSG